MPPSAADRRPALREVSSRNPVPPERAASGLGDIDPHIAAGYGPYARAAMADLVPEPEAVIEVRAANSNTMPGSRSSEVPDSGLVPRTATPHDEPSPTVVPLPVRPRPQAGVPTVEMKPRPDPEPSAMPEGTVDVIMRRETATFRIPVSHATLPSALLSDASAGAGPDDPVARPATAQIEMIEPIAQIARALEVPAASGTDELLNVDFIEIEDPDLDDVSHIAGRLRPNLSGS